MSPSRHSYHPEPEIREEGGTPGDRGVGSRRARVRAQGRGRQRGDPPPRARPRAPRARIVGRQPAASRSSATPRSSASRSSRSACATRRAAPRELRRRRAQRPVRDPGAQRLLLRRAVPPPALPDRRRLVSAHGAPRWRRATRAPSSRSRGSASTTSSARRCSTYIVDAVHLLARRRLEAPAALPVRSRVPASGTTAPAAPEERQPPRRADTERPRDSRPRPTACCRSARGGTADHRRRRRGARPPARSTIPCSATSSSGSAGSRCPARVSRSCGRPDAAITRTGGSHGTSLRSDRSSAWPSRRQAAPRRRRRRERGARGRRPDDGHRRGGVQLRLLRPSSTSRSRSSPVCSSSSS